MLRDIEVVISLMKIMISCTLIFHWNACAFYIISTYSDTTSWDDVNATFDDDEGWPWPYMPDKITDAYFTDCSLFEQRCDYQHPYVDEEREAHLVDLWHYWENRSGNRSHEDEPHSDRPTTIFLDGLRKQAEQHPYEGAHCFAAALGCSPFTVDNGLRSLRMVNKLGQWHPHVLTDNNRRRRLDIFTQLLSRSRTCNWLDTIVTGDEKWVLYVNRARKRAEIFRKK
ncbi:unnamed protein product [Heligmosomoides polygyrus]|uniref:HTH_48 domain-containing protein n=1 Tax=Heligmosomoides polygyrus TaxID=6339 RepID=A0A3P8EJW6_HELPZ|nr:unnamed protein product [Heligmosomoides polygyrus]